MNTETLYIGNATKQMLDFKYRIGREAPVWTQMIPAGTQIRIPGDLTPAQVDHVVKSQAKYGIVAADSIDQARGFHGLCYSIGKAITTVRLTMLMEKNHDALLARGREIREQSAVAQNNMLEATLREQGRPEHITQMDLTIQQENHEAGDPVPQLSEGFRIVRSDGSQTPAPRARRRMRKAA